MAIFTILYGNYYPPHGEFKLICIGNFTRKTWVNFTQQFGKNRQRCKINFTMLYGNYCYICIENFPQKFSPCRLLALTVVFKIIADVWFLYDLSAFVFVSLFIYSIKRHCRDKVSTFSQGHLGIMSLGNSRLSRIHLVVLAVSQAVFRTIL